MFILICVYMYILKSNTYIQIFIYSSTLMQIRFVCVFNLRVCERFLCMHLLHILSDFTLALQQQHIWVLTFLFICTHFESSLPHVSRPPVVLLICCEQQVQRALKATAVATVTTIKSSSRCCCLCNLLLLRTICDFCDVAGLLMRTENWPLCV